MADTPFMAETLAELKRELALAKAISGGPAGHEPAYRYLGDPPGKSVIQAYLHQQQPAEPTENVSKSMSRFSLEETSKWHKRKS